LVQWENLNSKKKELLRDMAVDILLGDQASTVFIMFKGSLNFCETETLGELFGLIFLTSISILTHNQILVRLKEFTNSAIPTFHKNWSGKKTLIIY